MHWRMDFQSKLIDGLLTAVGLYALSVTMLLLVAPIRALVGRPGVLIYTLVLMAISVFCLERSLQARLYEPVRAHFAMFSGLIAWTSVSISNDLGIPSITSVTGILVMILFTLTVTRLWRRSLPLGGRFYSIALMLSWVAELIIDSRAVLRVDGLLIERIYIGVGIAALIGVLLTLWWIITQTYKRLDRLSAAPILAFFAVIAVTLLG
jgi:hypothetical protein